MPRRRKHEWGGNDVLMAVCIILLVLMNVFKW